jgi:uncharacterized protein YcnI
MSTKTILALAVAALGAAPAASAHVTVNPKNVAADSFARFDVRVPNEQATADTNKITLQIPDGLAFVGFQPKPGWTRTVTMKKLAKPVTVEGETIREQVGTVTWSGGRIAPGEFDEFGLSAKVPDTVGRVLVFPAVQRYSNGDVVRWIGSADADEPAPRVTLEAKGADAMTQTRPTVNVSGASVDDDNGRANVALVLGAAGLAAGLAGLGVALFGRRRT